MKFESFGAPQPEKKDSDIESATPQKNVSRAVLGSLVMGAALAAAPDSAEARVPLTETQDKNIQKIERESTLISAGVASHPELGKFKIEFLYKQGAVDTSDPKAHLQRYELRINDVPQKIVNVQRMKNGLSNITLAGENGVVEKVFFPGFGTGDDKPATYYKGAVEMVIQY